MCMCITTSHHRPRSLSPKLQKEHIPRRRGRRGRRGSCRVQGSLAFPLRVSTHPDFSTRQVLRTRTTDPTIGPMSLVPCPLSLIHRLATRAPLAPSTISLHHQSTLWCLSRSLSYHCCERRMSVPLASLYRKPPVHNGSPHDIG